MNEEVRLPKGLGVLHLADIDWYFRVHLLRGDLTEGIARDVLFGRLDEKVRIIASQFLSSEFEYLRSGFALAHYGRRGVTYSLWHWADWGGTWELFCQAWYCYGRAFEQMLPLDRREPILCHHEVDLVMREARTIREIRRGSQDLEVAINEYRRCEARSAEQREQ